MVIEGFEAAGAVQIVPPIKSRSRNAELLQRAAYRQMGLFDELDDLQLFGSRISHSASSPSPITLFLSRRFSSVSSATTSFRALASRRRSLTSSEVAAAPCRQPAASCQLRGSPSTSGNQQFWTLPSRRQSSAMLSFTPQAFQHDADLFFG